MLEERLNPLPDTGIDTRLPPNARQKVSDTVIPGGFPFQPVDEIGPVFLHQIFHRSGGQDRDVFISVEQWQGELRRPLAGTNIIEAMNGSIRQVRRNVKRWQDARMALRWTAAGMPEAGKGFRRLNACKQLPVLKAALEKQRAPQAGAPVDPMAQAA